MLYRRIQPEDPNLGRRAECLSCIHCPLPSDVGGSSRWVRTGWAGSNPSTIPSSSVSTEPQFLHWYLPHQVAVLLYRLNVQSAGILYLLSKC